jgi:N-carbamoylputrescine amidase
MTAKIALVTEVFTGERAAEHLGSHLDTARRQGAALVLLPELPFDAWMAATRKPNDDHAEPPGGWRQQLLADAARAAGVAVLGTVIERDPGSGRRHNTSLLVSADGSLLATYRKAHLPWEEGYWEAAHYDPGDEPPEVVEAGGLRIGVQICSDANRPQGSNLLGASGAELIAVPRATPIDTYARWRLVLRANAVTSTAWVASINRPRPEAGVPMGGPSLVVAPDGTVVLETNEPVATVDIDREAVRRARQDYPGYLPQRCDLYADGWSRAAAKGG